MALRFHNTLTQQLEEFTPRDGKSVRMYTCGPTVYNYVHIGNLRTFLFQDVLRRWLRYRGYKLDHVMNITDVEDKIIRSALEQGKSLKEYTEPYEQAFLEDSGQLRLERPERIVRATEHIPEMVSAIETLRDKGYTYVSDGSIYYRISKFDGYGKLSHLDVAGIRAGARVDVDEYDKADARDFVLWKSRRDNEFFWETSIGEGRPGWHIECSAMAMKYLGETLDIHTGGIDLSFPHHENEIAQSEAITGKQFVRYWLHAEHLFVDGQKMSKSLGNFYTLRDLIGKGYRPEVIRYRLAAIPYRQRLNFTFDGLQAAATSIERLRNFKLRLETDTFVDGVSGALTERSAKARLDFESSLDDDLNTAGALAAIFEYIRDLNSVMDAGDFRAGNTSEAIEVLGLFDSIFDVLKPSLENNSIADVDVDRLIAERQEARRTRDFRRSDEIRAELLEVGVILEDTKEGIRWKRK